jgi:hypothetical protein
MDVQLVSPMISQSNAGDRQPDPRALRRDLVRARKDCWRELKKRLRHYCYGIPENSWRSLSKTLSSRRPNMTGTACKSNGSTPSANDAGQHSE